MSGNGVSNSEDRREVTTTSPRKSTWEKPEIADFKIATVTRNFSGTNTGDGINNAT